MPEMPLITQSQCCCEKNQPSRAPRRRQTKSLSLLFLATTTVLLIQPRLIQSFFSNNGHSQSPKRPLEKHLHLPFKKGTCLLAQQQQDPSPIRRKKPVNKRTQLQWEIQSIQHYGQDPEKDIERGASGPLLHALDLLKQANTQKRVLEAGQELALVDLKEESRPIQERVVKATALAGLFKISMELLQEMLSSNYLPSRVSYTAVCHALRQAGRTEQLQTLLEKLVAVARLEQSTVHVVAFNTYLACLCQHIHVSNDPLLDNAYQCLQTSFHVYGIEPDMASYNTVLHAACRTGNRTLANQLWQTMQDSPTLRPDIFSYNSRLQLQTPLERLESLEIIQKTLQLTADRFTIDLVILPLIRAGRIGTVEQLLDDFCASSSARVVSDAFSAFLVTLVKQGELASARALFDTYVMPCVVNGNSNANTNGNAATKTATRTDKNMNPMTRSVQPTVRHFNVLIEGYRQQAEYAKEKALSSKSGAAGNDENVDDDNGDDKNNNKNNNNTYDKTSFGNARQEEFQFVNDPEKTSDDEARLNGRQLYRLMIQAGIPTDDYTLTSMMGLSSSSDELAQLIVQHRRNLDLNPVAVRAAMTAFGNMGDASSACIIFDLFGSGPMNTRRYNVLLGALAEGAKMGNSVLRVSSCIARILLDDNDSWSGGDYEKDGILQNDQEKSFRICKLANGRTCTEAVESLLNLMGQAGSRTPPPNSQSFCLAASALQYGPTDATLALDLFRNATYLGIPADGRFINAVFRCFGDDIESALSAWKGGMRSACVAHESRTRTTPQSIYRSRAKNLIPAYNGLLYVCGRALRPDVALRIAYALNKEGIEPNDISLNCYRSGTRTRERLKRANNENPRQAGGKKLLPNLRLIEQYENLLFVECTKYDTNDKRRDGDKRVRIIV
jgi:pentatricopeptide repeat protein